MTKAQLENIKALTEYAIEKKIISMKVGDVEINLHPAAFIPESPEAPAPEKLTDEEKLIKQKKEFDDDLFHSA